MLQTAHHFFQKLIWILASFHPVPGWVTTLVHHMPLAFHLGHEADHSPLSGAKVKEWVELCLHSPSAPSWQGAQLGGAQGQLFPSCSSCSQYVVNTLLQSLSGPVSRSSFFLSCLPYFIRLSLIFHPIPFSLSILWVPFYKVCLGLYLGFYVFAYHVLLEHISFLHLYTSEFYIISLCVFMY
jgi:hypothetical protein